MNIYLHFRYYLYNIELGVNVINMRADTKLCNKSALELNLSSWQSETNDVCEQEGGGRGDKLKEREGGAFWLLLCCGDKVT